MSKKANIIIPARYGSSRYRGKPLAKILGREMVLRVADICSKVVDKKRLFIATDSKKILNVAKKSNYNAILTSTKCLTGTDRVAEASKKIKSNIFINVQGDEPTINPKDIKKIIEAKIKYPKDPSLLYNPINIYPLGFKDLTEDQQAAIFATDNTQFSFNIDTHTINKVKNLFGLDKDETFSVQANGKGVSVNGKSFNAVINPQSNGEGAVTVYKKYLNLLDREEQTVHVTDSKIVFQSTESETLLTVSTCQTA